MKRHILGLSQATQSNRDVEDGEYLVRVNRAQYRWDKTKPYYVVRFEILEPATSAGTTFNGRIYCSVKALWKLNWFLRDFAYDLDLLGHDQIDDKALAGLQGVVKISYTNFNGRSYLNLDGFAPTTNWPDFQLEKAS